MKRGEMLDKMILLATNAHHGQFDRGGNPYILHPLAVMQILQTVDEELQCIAIGHDVIEDSAITFQDLRDLGFTDRIVDAISALTKQNGQTYEEYKDNVFSNRDAMLVKMADLQHNSDIRRLKGVREKDIARMVKYQVFYMEIREKLVEK